MRLGGTVAVALAAGLGAFGCTNEVRTVTPSSVLGDLAPAPGATVVLVGPNGTFSFSPAAVTIHPGETVQWNWAGAPHTVASGVPGAPDGKFCSIPAGVVVSATSCNSVAYAQGIGATYSQTDAFLQPGTYPYFCTVHGALETGTVTSAP